MRKKRGIVFKSASISIIFAVLIVIIVQYMETGSIAILFQFNALLIVIGGTICATVINFRSKLVLDAIKSAADVFRNTSTPNTNAIMSEILYLSDYSRRNGVFELNKIKDEIQNSFLRRAVQLILDLNDPQAFSDILSSEIDYEDERELIHSRVFEAMGGYAPTFGIVGAVMGLIQVMSNVEDITLLASGIAIAFVSTLYGVGFANLLFLPVAGNLKLKLRDNIMTKQMIMQGVISIYMEEHSSIIEEKLLPYIKTQKMSLLSL